MKIKKGLTQLEAVKSVRKTWGFSPVSRRVEGKNGYRRHLKFKNGRDE